MKAIKETATKTYDWTAKARGWTVNHFSISEHRGDVPRLLRKVARSIDELGEVEVQGITYSVEVGDPNDTSTVTVYFHFGEAPKLKARAKKPASPSGPRPKV